MYARPVRSILCFGDSNTYGYLASMQGERLGRWERWPGVAQRELGEDWYLIEEGLNGRTTMFDRPDSPLRSGLAVLPMLLETHAPLDAVVIALGTNDVFVPGVSAARAAAGVETLTTAIRESGADPPPAPRWCSRSSRRRSCRWDPSGRCSPPRPSRSPAGSRRCSALWPSASRCRSSTWAVWPSRRPWTPCTSRRMPTARSGSAVAEALAAPVPGDLVALAEVLGDQDVGPVGSPIHTGQRAAISSLVTQTLILATPHEPIAWCACRSRRPTCLVTPAFMRR